MKFIKKSHVVVGMVLCAVIGIIANVYPHNRSEHMTVQDINSLDRRISLIEQRFFSLESSMNRLQQVVVAQSSSVSPTRVRDQEINQLRDEVQKLSLRINEIECGLVKLDERTATRKSDPARVADPCRSNPAAPLRLTTRP